MLIHNMDRVSPWITRRWEDLADDFAETVRSEGVSFRDKLGLRPLEGRLGWS